MGTCTSLEGVWELVVGEGSLVQVVGHKRGLAVSCRIHPGMRVLLVIRRMRRHPVTHRMKVIPLMNMMKAPHVTHRMKVLPLTHRMKALQVSHRFPLLQRLLPHHPLPQQVQWACSNTLEEPWLSWAS